MSDSKLFADRMLSLGVARMSEAAAIAAAPSLGRGDEKSADAAAVEAMRTQINLPDIAGIVGGGGQGERHEAPVLHVGEKAGNGPAWLSDHFGLTAQSSAAQVRRALAREAQ